MNRLRIAVLGIGIGAMWCTTAQAIWVDDCAHQIRCGHEHNVKWPWPFVCPDRIAAREPFQRMVANGWRRQNLLGAHHFDDETGKLTTAGELKVHWIMTQAPPQYRKIFIERSLDAEVTQKRSEAANDYAVRVAMDGATPDVQDTYLISEGRPAATVDQINVRFFESMRPPVLPEPGKASSLGGGD